MEHPDLIFVLAVAFVAARVGAELAQLARLPGLVGEVIAGVIAGPSLLGLIPRDSVGLETLAEVAVVFLLFIAGMETDLSSVRRAAKPATAVAVAGMVLPFAGGFLVMNLAGEGTQAALFVGIALMATSVGVTVQSMKEIGKLDTPEGATIIGAAVLDDVGSLLMLGAVTAWATGGSLGRIGVIAVSFLVVAALAVGFGPRGFGKLSGKISRLRATEPVLGIAIAAMLALAATTEALGLAPIVGAFLAGLMLGEARGQQDLEAKIAPIGSFLLPFFFVWIGASVDLAAIGRAPVWITVAVILIAIAGKFIGGAIGAIGSSLSRRAVIGAGMVPRGEVGLIVAALGAELQVSDELFGAVVAMVLVTTILAPPAMKLIYARAGD